MSINDRMLSFLSTVNGQRWIQGQILGGGTVTLFQMCSQMKKWVKSTLNIQCSWKNFRKFDNYSYYCIKKGNIRRFKTEFLVQQYRVTASNSFKITKIMHLKLCFQFIIVSILPMIYPRFSFEWDFKRKTHKSNICMK